jgi:acyl-CoA thioester hydrolase
VTGAADLIAESRLRVRYAETDAMGIVHHSSYVVWFEAGRSDWMRLTGRGYADFERDGYFLPVTELTVRYLAPLRYDEVATVRTRVGELRSRKVRFEYEVSDEAGRICATGQSGHICTTRDGRVASLPRTLLARLASAGQTAERAAIE